MGDEKNLTGKEAIEKLRTMVKDIDFCMFCSNLKELPFATRPMSTRDVDDDGNIWFFSRAHSNKNLDIE